MELGDEIRVDSHAPYLKIFDQLTPASFANTPASVGAYFAGNASSKAAANIIVDSNHGGDESCSVDNSSSRSSYAKSNSQKSIDSGGVLNDDPFA